MAGITFITGDATCPRGKGNKLICHVCNDAGKWGKGFVLAISRRWPEPEVEYRAWYAGRKSDGFALGEVRFVRVEPYVWVANMVAQRGTKTGSSGPPRAVRAGPHTGVDVTLPSRLTVHDAAYALDGGTTSLRARDEAGREHAVLLVQHSRPEASPSFDAVPGRLYYDGELVPIRSALESGILSLLKSAEVRYVEPHHQGEPLQLSPNALILGDDIRDVLTRGTEDNIRALTARVVGFVESDEYLRFAERVEQAADGTRYDVRVVSDGDSLGRAVIKTKQLLGLDLRGAKALVEQGSPVARGVTAVDVVEWARRYRESDLGVRVSPAFRWRLP